MANARIRHRLKTKQKRAEQRLREEQREQDLAEEKEQNVARQRRRDMLFLSSGAFRELEASATKAPHLDDFDFRSFLKWAQGVLRNWDLVDLYRAANLARRVLSLPNEKDLHDPRLIVTCTFLIDCLDRSVVKGDQRREEQLEELVNLLRGVYRATDENPGPANELRLAKALVEHGDKEEAEQVLLKLYRKGSSGGGAGVPPESIVAEAGLLLHQISGTKHLTEAQVQQLSQIKRG